MSIVGVSPTVSEGGRAIADEVSFAGSAAASRNVVKAPTRNLTRALFDADFLSVESGAS